MSVIGFYTKNGKRKPITARRARKLTRRSAGRLSETYYLVSKALEKEFPDVSVYDARDKSIVLIYEDKPHPGDCDSCEACRRRENEIRGKASRLLKRSRLLEEHKFDVIAILRPKQRRPGESQALRKVLRQAIFEDLAAMQRRGRRK